MKWRGIIQENFKSVRRTEGNFECARGLYWIFQNSLTLSRMNYRKMLMDSHYISNGIPRLTQATAFGYLRVKYTHLQSSKSEQCEICGGFKTTQCHSMHKTKIMVVGILNWVISWCCDSLDHLVSRCECKV